MEKIKFMLEISVFQSAVLQEISQDVTLQNEIITKMQAKQDFWEELERNGYTCSKSDIDNIISLVASIFTIRAAKRVMFEKHNHITYKL